MVIGIELIKWMAMKKRVEVNNSLNIPEFETKEQNNISIPNNNITETSDSEVRTTETISETEETSASSINNDNEDKSNLDHEKKLEIYDYIETEEEKYGDNITDEQTDKIWKKAEEIYKISENDIYEIMSDTDLIKEYYSSSEKEETDDYVGQYDAVLSNSGYGVVVTVTKDAMNEYINALSKNDKSTIQSLYSLGYIAKISEGTKVDVIETGISMSKVRILEGIYKGYIFYSINECIEIK